MLLGMGSAKLSPRAEWFWPNPNANVRKEGRNKRRDLQGEKVGWADSPCVNSRDLAFLSPFSTRMRSFSILISFLLSQLGQIRYRSLTPLILTKIQMDQSRANHSFYNGIRCYSEIVFLISIVFCLTFIPFQIVQYVQVLVAHNTKIPHKFN